MLCHIVLGKKKDKLVEGDIANLVHSYTTWGLGNRLEAKKGWYYSFSVWFLGVIVREGNSNGVSSDFVNLFEPGHEKKPLKWVSLG